MANIPPGSGPNENVTTAFDHHHNTYPTAPSALPSQSPVAPGRRIQPSDPSPAMLQTQTLPSLHHAFPGLSRVGLPASHIQLPPLDTRLARPPFGPEPHPLPAPADDGPLSKRRRIEAPGPVASGVHRYADSPIAMRRSSPDGSDPRSSASRNVIPSSDYTLDEGYHGGRPAPRLTTAGDDHCCQIGCTGQHCLSVRRLVADLIAEITERDISLPETSTADLREHASPLPHLHKISLLEALEWAVHRLRWNNGAIKQLLISQKPGQQTTSAPTSASADPFAASTSAGPMKRQHEPAQPDQDTPPRSSMPPQAPPVRQSWGPLPELWGHDQNPQSSHRKFSASSTPAPTTLQSPPHNPLSAAARMLPSPSSMTLSNPTALGSPALSAFPTSAAQTAHLQDLQHQVSVKTLSLSTLQREYESLLQKLERQRTKSAALERKFEVSDAELNGLIDDKERLEKQVEMLEKQLEEAQTSRDEARKQSSEQAAQYMRILDMGNILQRKAVDDRKTWEKEKENLIDRIKELEEAELSSKAPAQLPLQPPSTLPDSREEGTPSPNISRRLDKARDQTTSPRLPGPSDAILPKKASPTIAGLEQELERLRGRVQTLEAALAASKREGEIIKEAALRLANLNSPTDSS